MEQETRSEANLLDNITRNSQTRSMSKTVTWRILATLITGTVVYLYTGKIRESGEIVITAEIVLTLAYYLHERFWAHIKK